MKKITLLGAGSGFTQPLFTDILNIEGLDAGVIGLVDIDARRLEINERLMNRVIELMGKTGWRVEASTDRTEVLPGTDYVINTIEVSGEKCVRWDYEIPMKYGVDQCIGDTIGPGGILKALRTVPVWLEILKDVERLCPGALVMNYTNPMSIMSLASVRSTEMPFVGLCHSVQGTSRLIARLAEVPHEELVFKCGGLNHMAWFTELRWKGKDVYPRLHAAMEDEEKYEQEPVRLEMMKEFGYFVTESSGHFSEYVPYFRKRKDVMKQYCRDGYRGESGIYSRSWPKWRKDLDKKRRAMADGKMDPVLTRGFEYASDIIEAHVFDRPKIVYASVANTGLIPNLSQDATCEVAVLVDSRGFSPTYFGRLPEQVAALCRSNLSVFELVVEGILSEDAEAVIHGLMVDPLTAAVCSPAEARAMARELFEAERRYIPRWCQKKRRVRKVQLTGAKKRKRSKGGAEEVSSMAARGTKKS
jgi:alpha-galactosidase